MDRYSLRITAAVTFFLVLSPFFFSDAPAAMNWPSESANLIRNFGWNDRGRPVLGMVFSGGTDVLAAEKGEMIFSRRKDDVASRLPSPLGAWTALDHGDGLISIYSRCEEINHSYTNVEKQEIVASAGISGWSKQKGFYFIVYDRRERRWINPAMIVTPMKDIQAQQILSVNMMNSQGSPVVQPRNIQQGRYSVIVTTGARGSSLAPQKIVCLVNGTEAGSLNFEVVSARDGVLMVSRNGLVPARQIYANFPAFEAAEVFFNRGQATMEIIVQDIAGNSRSIISRISVN
ncbi:MAG: M23 family metallopeptidase [Treponema sp.]|jgi:hypothetical protein|nr:M23 family metallopeptidase [Treponema sp.]